MQLQYIHWLEHFGRINKMIFTLIQIGVIFLILYFLAHELKDSWTTHKKIRKLERKWDEWERIPGYWDVYIAERGGVTRFVQKPDPVEVKTSMGSETAEIAATCTMPKISPTHSLVPTH
jgi:hypothetical protein